VSPDRGAQPKARPTGRHPGLVVAVLTAHRIRRGALGWGAVFGGLTALLAVDFPSSYPTATARADLVRTMASDTAQQAMFGPARRIATTGGYVAFHGVGVFAILIGSVWALLVATRLLRGEEAAGRWEVLLAGATTRRRATLAPSSVSASASPPCGRSPPSPQWRSAEPATPASRSAPACSTRSLWLRRSPCCWPSARSPASSSPPDAKPPG